MRPWHARILALALVLLPSIAAVGRAAPAGDAPSWPEGCDPAAVGERLIENLLARPPIPSTHSRRVVHYSEGCTYLGALRFTALTGRDEAQRQLLQRLDDLLLGVDGRRKAPHEWHVDDYMFGAVPLEAYLATRERYYLIAGKHYADKQWRNPRPDGLTQQTRFWIDDMYMVGVLQAQAYRATGDAVYADRAARQLAAYTDRLQQPGGLFYHGKDSTRYWGRGNGWVASALAEVLAILPEDHPERTKLLDAYQRMMRALVAVQGADGMWRQLLDEPEAWPESSCSAMFTYALAVGVREGWLEPAFGDAARRGWAGLCGYVDAEGNVREVCVGTGQSDHRQYYLDRPRETGDFHGQAATLWAATAIIQLDRASAAAAE